MSIFIGNLSYDADDSAISQYVSGVAQVTSAQVMRYQNGDSKGYAIVQMASQQDADNAIQQLNRSMFMDQELNVREDRGPAPNRRNGGGGGARQDIQMDGLSLHVSNLSWGTQNAELHGCFQEFGATEAQVMSHEDTGRSKGWGLVYFGTEQNAQMAMQQMQGADLDGRAMRIKVNGDRGPARGDRPQRRERRKREPRPERVENCSGLSVYLGNLAWSVDDNMLSELVQSYRCAKSEVMYGNSGRSRGFAILNFNSAQDAQFAVDGLDGFEFEGRQVQARLDKFS